MSNLNSVTNTASGKISIIDQSTYEQFRQDSKGTYTIKNVKYKKSQQTFNLGQFIRSKREPKKRTKRTAYAIYKTGKKSIKKCKHRQSKLKKCILKCRLLKLSSDRIKCNSPASSETEDVTLRFENLTVGIRHKSGLHSRRFREYCDNTTSKELSNLIETLLRELHRFQKRAFQSNEYKGRCHRRIVIGFREVQAQMLINKIKFVVIATDCETCDLQGGLDEIIMNIKQNCRNNLIPYAFALQRRQLGYILLKKRPISCVGVLDFDGAQEIFFKTLNIVELEKVNYKLLSPQTSSE